MIDKIKDLINKLNEKGIPLPMLRDPKTSVSSVSLTMMFLSFNVVLVGLIGKWSNALGGVDLTQALYWFGMCSSLYFFRKLPNMANKTKDGNETSLKSGETEENDK